MFNKRKSFLLGSIAISSLLVGCDNKEPNIEIVDEFEIAENKDINEENVNDKKEDVSLEDNKVDEDIKENNATPQENTSENKGSVSQNSTSTPSNVESNASNKVENVSNKNNSSEQESASKEDNMVLVENPTFTQSEIPEAIRARMMGKSMKENDAISFDDLSYLTITYLDYNGDTRQGEMVVHKKLADEVLDIFRDIYNAKFPIEKMNLVDDYNADDHTSMVNNNSSAFCYRTIAGTNKVSNHGMGMAIDINPFYNPHVLKKSGTVNPPEASKYADRSLNAKGMIKKNDAVYKAFTSRGWTWGGNWNNPDYQHFEKKI